ncbi:FAD-binding oxidoreductase [Bosea sp. RCC_152_1]|uniref:FAD-binding oxidoreductase n=1 Tax=Bosea sp. RCC_152_1 TaxID=3239228 RepID=UPI0035250535
MDSIAQVLARLSPGIVTRDQDIIATYTTDFRRQYAGSTRAVLRPRHAAEVQDIVRCCAELGVPLVPQGGNTGYCTAATPSDRGDELVISLERMNRLRELDRANLSVCVEAGIILSELQQAASEADLLLPLALGSQQSCRIGGNLSTNAGGISVLRYGMARDLVLGLEVVLPDGSLYSELSPLRKNNSGYDVKQLFIGAEGTLGIITAASLKLARKPSRTVTAFLAIDDITSLAAILDLAQIQTGELISSFEYISDTSLNLLLDARKDLRHPLQARSGHYILLEAATASPVLNLEETVTGLLGELFERGLVTDGTIAANGQQVAEFWRLRECIPEAEVHHGGSVKHDIAVRTSRLAAFVQAASQIVREDAEGAILSVYGHVGDGNVHFNVVAPSTAQAAPFKHQFERDVSPKIYRLAAEMGGTFSAEYGIGRVKMDLLERYGAPGKVDLMRRLKAALDPNGTMNPGKVVIP